jgi:hypothetical protein
MSKYVTWAVRLGQRVTCLMSESNVMYVKYLRILFLKGLCFTELITCISDTWLLISTEQRVSTHTFNKEFDTDIQVFHDHTRQIRHIWLTCLNTVSKPTLFYQDKTTYSIWCTAKIPSHHFIRILYMYIQVLRLQCFIFDKIKYL